MSKGEHLMVMNDRSFWRGERVVWRMPPDGNEMDATVIGTAGLPGPDGYLYIAVAIEGYQDALLARPDELHKAGI